MNGPEPEFQTELLRRIYQIVREEYDPDFTFQTPGPIPWAQPVPELAACRIALVTSGGLHLRTDRPFDALQSRFGDTSFRVIPHRTPAGELDLAAGYVDDKYTARNPEVALPMAALDELHSRGQVGAPAPRHYSFCGGIIRPFPGLTASAGELAELLSEDAVGAVALLPNCSICVQTVCLLARELEARRIPTVAFSQLPELSRFVGAPRTLHINFPFGAPCGDPDHADLRRAVLLEALNLLETAEKPGSVRESSHVWRRSPA